MKAFPTYVLIDKKSAIVDRQDGAGGYTALEQLLASSDGGVAGRDRSVAVLAQLDPASECPVHRRRIREDEGHADENDDEHRPERACAGCGVVDGQRVQPDRCSPSTRFGNSAIPNRSTRQTIVSVDEAKAWIGSVTIARRAGCSRSPAR